MNSTSSRTLNSEIKEEFAALLLLEQMMRYDLSLQEKNELIEIVTQLEQEVAELSKGFFHSDDQDEELDYKKQDLNEAKQAVEEVEKERTENEAYRLCIVLEGADDESLEPMLKKMEEKGIIEVGEDEFFTPTAKGREIYEQLVDQLDAYVVHFDVYAYVNLEEGTFADPETDLLESEEWSDLRVAVAEHKGIDAFRVVFLAMLSSELFFDNSDWKFDLAMGTLFDEMDNIVQEQLCVDDLGFEGDEGEVSGEDVISDIIEQGSEIASERRQKQLVAEEAEQERAIPNEQVITTTYW